LNYKYINTEENISSLAQLEQMLKVDENDTIHFKKQDLEKLVKRIDTLPLYAHSYSFFFHLYKEVWSPVDLLNFAISKKLSGVKCHIDDGETNSLYNMKKEERINLGIKARDNSLKWNIEISSTSFSELSRAVEVSSDLNATSIRCYPRYEGSVSSIISRTIIDLKRFRNELDCEKRFMLTIEQHEDLNSNEMVQIIKELNDPYIRLLFDSANMLNSNELPLDAWKVQSPFVSEVHLKDALILPDRGGLAQFGCRTGTGDIPLKRFLVEFLLLGEEEQQITSIGMEEEVNYLAPALRFPNDGVDPIIPAREPSITESLKSLSDEMLLGLEQRYAIEQYEWIKSTLDNIHYLASVSLKNGE